MKVNWSLACFIFALFVRRIFSPVNIFVHNLLFTFVQLQCNQYVEHQMLLPNSCSLCYITLQKVSLDYKGWHRLLQFDHQLKQERVAKHPKDLETIWSLNSPLNMYSYNCNESCLCSCLCGKLLSSENWGMFKVALLCVKIPDIETPVCHTVTIGFQFVRSDLIS